MDERTDPLAPRGVAAVAPVGSRFVCRAITDDADEPDFEFDDEDGPGCPCCRVR
jgi:hypothetical protein